LAPQIRYRLRKLLKLLNQPEKHSSYLLNQVLSEGVYDKLEIDASGLFRVIGWFKGEVRPELIPALYIDQHRVPFLHQYRVPRPDLAQSGESLSRIQPGIVLEYLLPEQLCSQVFQSVFFRLNNYADVKLDGPFQFQSPDYRLLFNSGQVYHREHIYGSGPPNRHIHPDVLALAKQLPLPMLDFGCGAGALMAELKASGMEIQGLEMESAPFVSSIASELARFMTFYNGSFPSPFPSGSFRSVFCSEVLEHIPDYQGAIREIARLATEKAIITVPDGSGIPLGSRHRLLPWHLLEGTHVNFFSQTSLEAALRPYFSQIDFGRIGGCRMNDTTFYVSLVAVCRK
jgi:SAM-dependent methyltransferase